MQENEAIQEPKLSCSRKKIKIAIIIIGILGWVVSSSLGYYIYRSKIICEIKKERIHKDQLALIDNINQKLNDCRTKNLNLNSNPETSPINNNKNIISTAKDNKIYDNNKYELNFHLLLSVIDLEDSANRGKEFNREFQTFKVIAKNFPDLKDQIRALEDISSTGISSLNSLKGEFDIVSTTINSDILKSTPSNNILQKFTSYFYSTVKIKKIDHNNNNQDARSILARTDFLLKDGNVTLALKELNKLPSEQKKVLNPWQEKASDYVEYHKTINSILEYIKTLVYNNK